MQCRVVNPGFYHENGKTGLGKMGREEEMVKTWNLPWTSLHGIYPWSLLANPGVTDIYMPLIDAIKDISDL